MGQATQRREKRTRDRLLGTREEDLSGVATPELLAKFDGDLAALPYEKLQTLYERSPGRFVRDWNRLLSGWLGEIGRRAHAVQEMDASEEAGGSASGLASAADPDAPSAIETAVLPILDKAERLLTALGESNKVAELLVGQTTRHLPTHECCKAIAGEADKRLYDLVYSRLFAVMQRASPSGTRRAEGQRARARRRRFVEQALSRPDLSVAPQLRRARGGDEPEKTETLRPIPVQQRIAAVEAVLRDDKHNRTRILTVGLPADAAQDLATAVDVHKFVVFSFPMHAESIGVIRRYGFGMIVVHPEGPADGDSVAGITEAILAAEINPDALVVVAGTDAGTSRPLTCARSRRGGCDRSYVRCRGGGASAGPTNCGNCSTRKSRRGAPEITWAGTVTDERGLTVCSSACQRVPKKCGIPRPRRDRRRRVGRDK